MSFSAPVYGVDGCRGGWLVVSQRTLGEMPTAKIADSIDSLISSLPGKAVVVIDMPIGLPEAEAPVRECDRLARKLLGKRHVCVFSPPCRKALHARSRSAASKANEPLGRKVTQQAWALRHKLIELDDWLASNERRRSQFHEAHPEISFAHWRLEAEELEEPTPFQTRKKRSAGRADRRALIDGTWPAAVDRAALSLGPKSGIWATDDLHDAFACLWTARRIAGGEAVRYPGGSDIPHDSRHLRMQIVA